ncbi:hypothetical protein M717_07030 [Neisseria gonorrhoeae SK33414]|uniref:Uncharacterized protein n=1 Tax=Neisseria gonorrhoeae 3502 TaxID=1193404 RepID=A0AA44ZHZ1_NEIGO|nr:hypothetical protein T556_09170 [Neisseria gonorrhoeae NG-k51.05]KEC86598.1 hypothetical protein DT75_11370 [Neisseria gonorrhoeae]KLR76443.1 hypothetical protein M717_07030 [Neisseria gonorrhoeae SK33414]KLR79272.1 hypothetical protein M679_12255 [Neisseria gonorrhoeae SK7842]KLR79619.1 hypothetical protein M680_11015 [Neisseria gonorrhoeae SK8976]KLR83338.1 hypothetical protein M675_03490 [Neisseria gonorrhoeae SK1902]KLR85178.1 hypothetical protein M684_08665 [Neisseria gonorrhoeae SK15
MKRAGLYSPQHAVQTASPSFFIISCYDAPRCLALCLVLQYDIIMHHKPRAAVFRRHCLLFYRQ